MTYPDKACDCTLAQCQPLPQQRHLAKCLGRKETIIVPLTEEILHPDGVNLFHPELKPESVRYPEGNQKLCLFLPFSGTYQDLG